MDWHFDSKQPIYTQLVDMLGNRIITGIYEPGSRLDSVRDLATQAGVNPNTMQRALAALEASGLIYAKRTAGRFVTEDTELIKKAKLKVADEKLRAFISEMESLGFSKEEILKLLEEFDYER